MFGFWRKKRAQPQERYEVKAVLRPDTSELDAALAKAEDLEATIKRARTLAGELARMTKLMKGVPNCQITIDSEAVQKATHS